MICCPDSEEPSSGQFQHGNTTSKHGKAKQKFTPEEDKVIIALVKRESHIFWPTIARFLPGRTARQVRERWVNFLDPRLNRNPWSDSEMALLLEKFREYGPSWSKLSKFFQGRTDVFLKNKWIQFQRRLLKNRSNYILSNLKIQQNDEDLIKGKEIFHDDDDNVVPLSEIDYELLALDYDILSSDQKILPFSHEL